MRLYQFGSQLLSACILLCLGFSPAYSQVCPPNVDFETGSFDGWTCYTGNVTGDGQNVISITPSGGPVSDRHTMYSASSAGGALDPYGNFPVNCPNGSGHSIRLGNNYGGGEAEGISYEFTIPANENYYTLIYNYAVVFQDPNHEEYQQPRMEIEITNLTDNARIHCSSFTFIPFGSILPGFFQSPNPGTETPVWCKDWTAVSINLDGHAGKTIRLFFKTADCTFRRHFGYAYIDVNSECSGTFTGAAFCPDDTVVNVVAPYGYQSYTWFNSTFTQVLGNQQILVLQPPPLAGTHVAVYLEPYAGYGCPDTLYALLLDSLTVTAYAGTDAISCNNNPVPIGTPPKPGLVYNWSPALGLSNPGIANPYAAPDVTTEYVVTTNHDGGGCIDTDTVMVRASRLDNSLQLLGSAKYCIGSGDSAVLVVQSTDNIQWYKDNVPITGANQTRFRVTQTGVYYAVLSNFDGCILSTVSQQINISTVPVAGLAPFPLTQCLVGNNFVFTNTSTNAIGAMQYYWLLGDGSTSVLKDITHSYALAGTYVGKMIVSSNDVCMDSVDFSVTIHQNAIADFIVKPVCINLPLLAENNTVDTMGSPVSYLWDFGNGQVSTVRNPPAQIYTIARVYPVSLSVYTAQCPTPIHKVIHNVLVDKPKPGIAYPDEYAIINLPLPIEARQIGETILWSPGTYLNTRTSFSPVFNGPVEQLYTMEIKTISGCLTVDTLLIKTVKEAEIHVPSAFTPNKDGLNDYLFPTLRGIKEVRYFRVYNRWGQIVYQSKNAQPGWDGTIGGTPQSTQVFVWMIEGISIDDRIYRQKGTCTLIR